MEKKILIVKNYIEEGAGLLEGLLAERSIKYHVADLDRGHPFPSVKEYQAVVVLGGPDSANDETEKMKNELTRIREIIDERIPYLGICLGLQTLVKATGGKVVKSLTKEVGFIGPDGSRFIIELTEKGKIDPLFENIDHVLNVFHLHGETVELTQNMELLAFGNFCRNQIVKIGQNAYGIQCHFELTPEMFEHWIAIDQDLVKLDKELLQANFDVIKKKYTETGHQLFQNFLKIAGF